MIIKSRRDRTLNHKVYDVLYREQLPGRQSDERSAMNCPRKVNRTTRYYQHYSFFVPATASDSVGAAAPTPSPLVK